MANFADFPEREYNVFQICRSFKPPFYVRTVSGLYDKDEDSCYSAGQVYAILHKLKIKSVIATVRGTSFKIPLDYEGQFSIVGQQQSGSLTMREIMETVTPQDLPQEVRLSNSPQNHGKHFLDMLDKIGRGIRTCNLTLSQEILDEYFIGRSPDGKLMIVFPGEAFMNFQVKKTNIQDVQHLVFNVKELKYDIFVTDANKPAAKFLTTEEAVYSSPKRPPKPAPSVRRQVSPTSAATGKCPVLERSNLALGSKVLRNSANRYGATNVDPPHMANKPPIKPKPSPKRIQEDREDMIEANTPPRSPACAFKACPNTPPNSPSCVSKDDAVSFIGDVKVKHPLSQKPQLTKWGQNQYDLKPSDEATYSFNPKEARPHTPESQSSKYEVQTDVRSLTKLSGMSGETPGESVISFAENQMKFQRGNRGSDKVFVAQSLKRENQMQFQRGKRASDKEFVTQIFRREGKDVQILLCSQTPPTPPKKPPTGTVRKRPPPIPPLHSYPISDEEKDTDEDYDEKVSGRSHSPACFPATPQPSPLSPSARQKANTPPLHPHPGGSRDTDGFYDSRMREAVGNIKESKEHYDSDDIGSDYESPLSADDYEQVETPPDDSTRSPPIPIPTKSPGAAKTQNSPKTGLAKTPDSPNSSRKPFELDKIRLQLNKQIRKFSKFRKKERSVDRTGDMADDELTEDPYAEQQQEQRKSTKTRTRRRNDPLPMPLSSGPSSASLPSSLPPPLPPSSSTARPRVAPPVPDSDSDSLSDYEKIDDDIPVQSTGGPRLPPGLSAFPSNYPQPIQPSKLSLPGYPQPLKVSLPPLPRVADEGSTKPNPHASATHVRPGNVAVVKPAPKQQQQPPPAATDEFPTDLCNLGVEAITQTLRKLNMPEEIIANFREAQIDGQIFVCLDETILDELGVRKLDKLKIIKFKNGWRPIH